MIPGLGHILIKRGIAAFIMTIVLLFLRVFIALANAIYGTDPTRWAERAS